MCFPYCFRRAIKGPVRWKSHDDLYVDIYTAKKKFFLRKCFLSFYLLIFSSLSSPFPPILTPKCISLAFQLIHWKHNSGCLLFCFGCPKSILILFELTHRTVCYFDGALISGDHIPLLSWRKQILALHDSAAPGATHVTQLQLSDALSWAQTV